MHNTSREDTDHEFADDIVRWKKKKRGDVSTACLISTQSDFLLLKSTLNNHYEVDIRGDTVNVREKVYHNKLTVSSQSSSD